MFKGCCFGNGRGGAHAAVDSPELPKRRLQAEGEGKATGVAKEADKVKDPEGNTHDTQETATIQGVGRPSSDMLLAKDKDGSNGISAVGRGEEKWWRCEIVLLAKRGNTYLREIQIQSSSRNGPAEWRWRLY